MVLATSRRGLHKIHGSASQARDPDSIRWSGNDVTYCDRLLLHTGFLIHKECAGLMDRPERAAAARLQDELHFGALRRDWLERQISRGCEANRDLSFVKAEQSRLLAGPFDFESG